MDNIKMDLPSDPKYLQMLRLSTSSLANQIGFDIEIIEDLKVVVSEIFTHCIIENERIRVDFSLYNDKIVINFFTNESEKEKGFNDISLEFKKQILLSLTDEFILEDDKITIIMNKA